MIELESNSNFQQMSPQQMTRHTRCSYIILGFVVIFHVVMMGIVVVTLTQIAPEVQTTLRDVNIMLPEMRRSLLELGQLLPEIKAGMSILQQLCTLDPECHYVP